MSVNLRKAVTASLSSCLRQHRLQPRERICKEKPPSCSRFQGLENHLGAARLTAMNSTVLPRFIAQ